MNTTLHSLFWRCTNYPAMGTKLFWLLELAASLFFSSGNHSPTVLTQDMFTEIVFSLGFNPRFCSLCLSRLELQHQNDTLMQKISISVSEIHYCVLKRKETHIIPREKNIALNPRFLSCNYFDIFFFFKSGNQNLSLIHRQTWVSLQSQTNNTCAVLIMWGCTV